jgi:MFS family permease
VGAATLAPSTLALLSAGFPEGPDRTRAMAAYGALAGIGTAFGLIVGGVLTSALSWRYGFFLNVPVGLAAILAAPRFLGETDRHAAHLDLFGALSSTLGASALVFGIVHSADAGWTAGSTIASLVAGIALLGLFVVNQARAEQPLLPLRLFADRSRAGAYAARFLFNAVPVTAAAFVAAAITSRTRVRTDLQAVAGCAAMLIGTAWMSRVSVGTGYLLGIAVPMVVFGIGQGLGLSSLTTAGMAGVQPRDAAVAGGLVNVAHHLGGAFGLGVLVTVFDAAGSPSESARAPLAGRVSAALTAACLFLALAVVVTLATRTRRHPAELRLGNDSAAA